ncbi:hypothetical protein ACE38W_11510 [Chitinophaga sp. Hz27]|uniref:hypothetical protein n=1 Tax=Chitinophaga sp. Hz27 TaxID=3347169 RepID=UPI0035DA9EAF
MNNLYLLNQSFDIQDLDTFFNGIVDLIEVRSQPGSCEIFSKSESIYSLASFYQLFDKGYQETNAVVKFLEQIKSIEPEIKSETEFDTRFPNDCNGFMGIDFTKCSTSKERQVSNKQDLLNFRAYCNSTTTYKNIFARRQCLFPKLVLCEGVEAQLFSFGNSLAFNVVVEKLRLLNDLASKWVSGGFTYHDFCKVHGLEISGESDTTMNNKKCKRERTFALPDGQHVVFELHAKISTAALRIHIYPDEKTTTLYVGYVGKHLST